MDSLRKSLREFGFVQPVVVQKSTGFTIGGHQRTLAAIAEGFATVPVIILDIANSKAGALNLALNRIGGEFDSDQLPAMLQSLDETDLGLTGFTEEELEDALSVEQSKIQEIDLRPPPKLIWVLLGIPVDEFGAVQQHVAALEKNAKITVQSSK